MPNGSPEKLIFGNLKIMLQWAQRYMILKGVSTSLLYLHEMEGVVHKDIISINVLLDSNLNAIIGYFRLACLHDHIKDPQMTRVVGTLGYIAPERVQT
eukprot:Gb_39429 [translate_table: standard]